MDPSLYYSRQIRLKEVGAIGQERLKKAKCLVIGAGGLGSPSLLYLAAAGVGKIGICDGDRLEESNLHRQPIYSAKDVGQYKADLAFKRLKELNPLIEIEPFPFRLDARNALSFFGEYDLVLDCTDNFRTKFLINDAAFLAKKPVIRASIYQFEGEIQTYLPERGDACLRCHWEKVPEEGCVGTCQEVGVLGPVPGLFGVMQGMEAVKYFLKMPLLGKSEIFFMDLVHFEGRKISHAKRKECPLCGESPSIFSLFQKELWEIECEDLKKRAFQLVDIREKEEIQNQPYLKGHYLSMPMSIFDESSLDRDLSYAFFCQRGRRSARLVSSLREKGYEKTFSVIGGIEELSK